MKWPETKYDERLERAELRLGYYTTINECYRNDMGGQTLLDHNTEMAAAKKAVEELKAVVAECRAVDFRCGVGRLDHFKHTAPDTYPGVRANAL